MHNGRLDYYTGPGSPFWEPERNMPTPEPNVSVEERERLAKELARIADRDNAHILYAAAAALRAPALPVQPERERKLEAKLREYLDSHAFLNDCGGGGESPDTSEDCRLCFEARELLAALRTEPPEERKEPTKIKRGTYEPFGCVCGMDLFIPISAKHQYFRCMGCGEEYTGTPTAFVEPQDTVGET